MRKKQIYSKFEKGIIAEIHKQADALVDGWINLDVKGDAAAGICDFSVKLPKVPFERWAFGARFHRKNEWKTVSPLGMKMQMDNRDHTDWWLLTGLPLRMAYSFGRKYELDYTKVDPVLARKAELIEEAAWEYKYEKMEKRGKGSVFLVSTKKEFKARIFHVKTADDILDFVDEVNRWKNSYSKIEFVAVVPHCGVEFDLVIRYARAIITQAGSAAAHLVKVAREDKVPVILCPNAFDVYLENELIMISSKRIVGL